MKTLKTTELEACTKLELIHKLLELYQKVHNTHSYNKQEVQSLCNVYIQKNETTEYTLAVCDILITI